LCQLFINDTIKISLEETSSSVEIKLNDLKSSCKTFVKHLSLSKVKIRKQMKMGNCYLIDIQIKRNKKKVYTT
jgi:hypothetical protein